MLDRSKAFFACVTVNGRASDSLHGEEAHQKHGKTRFPKEEGDDFRHGKACRRCRRCSLTTNDSQVQSSRGHNQLQALQAQSKRCGRCARLCQIMPISCSVLLGRQAFVSHPLRPPPSDPSTSPYAPSGDSELHCGSPGALFN